MRRKHAATVDPVEVAIQHATSIGALERLAGIGPDREARVAFWQTYSALPGTTGFTAGVAALEALVRARGSLAAAA